MDQVMDEDSSELSSDSSSDDNDSLVVTSRERTSGMGFDDNRLLFRRSSPPRHQFQQGLYSSQDRSEEALPEMSPYKIYQMYYQFKEKLIGRIFYRHGLFCASHPWMVMFISLVVFAFSCYPILGVHLIHPSSSQTFVTGANDVSFDGKQFHLKQPKNPVLNSVPSSSSPGDGNFVQTSLTPPWFESTAPFAFIQQIIVKSAVIPWNKNLILMDAIRAPLQQVFPLVEFISNRQFTFGKSDNQSKSLMDFCLQVSEPIRGSTSSSGGSSTGSGASSSSFKKESFPFLPRYTCLVVSPGNFWQNDVTQFIQDPALIKTMHSVKDVSSPESSGNIREILFGVQWLESGIRRLYLTTRQRTITFAVTLVLSKYDPEFIDQLAHSLQERYPLSKNIPAGNTNKATLTPVPSVQNNNHHDMNHGKKNDVGHHHHQQQQENDKQQPNNEESKREKTSDSFLKEKTQRNITHLYFQERISYSEYIPLFATYFLLFSYVLFFVRKVDLIKNKVGLALGTLLTGIMTYLMSLGICLWFDFNPTLYPIDALPYIVSIVGLENMLVLTKSVVSTPGHLDIKVRIAQGLSKESFSSLRMLSFELTLLTLGYFTFVPVIQESCLFGFVGLISDMVLQMTFFTAILSIDLQRIELDGKPGPRVVYQHQRQGSDLSQTRSRSNSMNNRPTNVFARASQPTKFKLPKRLRLAYFWASTRMVHRTLMVGLVCWISFLVCNSGMTDHFTSHLQSQWRFTQRYSSHNHHDIDAKMDFDGNGHLNGNQSEETDPYQEELMKLSESSSGKIRSLSTKHWESLFRCYNISLTRRYISILPPIKLLIPVDPLTAEKSRHTSESDPQIFRQFLPGQLSSPQSTDKIMKDASKTEFEYLLNDPAAALASGIDSLDMESLMKYSAGRAGRWSRRDVWVALGLSVPSLVLLTYLVYVLYRCCCSRNYAEWRTSWATFIKDSWKWIKKTSKGKNERGLTSSETLFDAVPVKLTGYLQEIESITSSLESPFVTTYDLQGDLTVWDALSGECHTLIRRSASVQMHFRQLQEMQSLQQQQHQMLSQFQPHDHERRSFRANSFANAVNTSSTCIPSPVTASFSQRNTSSFSSDSTFASTPSSTPSSASFVNLSSMTPDPGVTHTVTPVINASFASLSSPSQASTSASTSTRLFRKQGSHRRHHSLSSIQASAAVSSSPVSVVGNDRSSNAPGSSSLQSNNNRAYDFSPFAQKLNSSRELLTDLIRNAFVSAPSSYTRNHHEQHTPPANSVVDSPLNFKSIWTMEMFGRYVYLGCENGRVEVWDALTGSLAYFHERSSQVNASTASLQSSSRVLSSSSGSALFSTESSGVTAIKVSNTRMIVAYLDGMMETYHLEPGLTPSSRFSGLSTSLGYRSVASSSLLPSARVSADRASSSSVSTSNASSSLPPSSLLSRDFVAGKSNTSTSPSLSSRDATASNYQLFYSLSHVLRAHRQAITVMELTGSQVITGSLDHTVKVHALSQERINTCLYTLHGHFGGITCIEVDPSSPSTAISGCQVGQVCVWDLQTGTCLFSLEAHQGSSVSAILPTPLYILSSGTDDKILIWDKYSGNLVHTIHQNHSLCKQMALLSSNILVTAKDDHIVLYDISEGSPVSIIDINEADGGSNAATAASTAEAPSSNSVGDGSSSTGMSFLRRRNGFIRNLKVSSQSRAVVCDSGLNLYVIHFPGVAEKYD